MLSFRDMVKNDLDLFFNTEELAETVTINGENVDVIIKSEALKKMKIKMGDGIHKAEVLFSVKKSDLPGKPKVDRQMTFNTADYKIMSCSETSSTYEVLLGTNQ